MTLDDRFSQLVRDAVGPMLTQELEHLEERLVRRLEALLQARSAPATAAPPLLTEKEVARRLRVSPRTLQRRVAAGQFPPPIKISAGRARWRQGDVDAWVERQEVR